ncbi:hydrogenase maturation protein HypF [Microbulbifer donghaiensis]|uniref:Carbamoyltransferase HypF n=1 Tax=Microbulbifer donghaiensis TaxID=494016 RepID=A0A1M4UPM8_9GAMM|nr:carbamoyltransferase HypF [Microbulbifer donghaiensis]SHE58701.1 hydrogenase maturation protein HypF [Microbulbifer donghaiensis]
MTTERLHIAIGGLVQGVGFRPFVYRLARDCDLSGWVANDSGGVQIEIQGEGARIREFLRRLPIEKPRYATIDSLTTEARPLCREVGFIVRQSDSTAAPAAVILPDLAPCSDCLREMSDPDDRRYRYPFTNCTLCGPRFSIVARLPYDRVNTSMSAFPLCEPCREEYENPLDRRFHAEPVACPACGPQLQLCDASGTQIAVREAALQLAAEAIAEGRIVALKSVGGFQLLVDAANSAAVARLRDRKRRPHKTLALLYPDIESVMRDCRISALEKAQLESPQRPIVLLAARASAGARIATAVAPHNPNLGVMLPASPLHQLLVDALQRPLVATSGNLSAEPICYDNDDAIRRLGAIADLFLLHDREIQRPLDDSVVREMDGQTVMLRRARGYAPMPIEFPAVSGAQPSDFLAVGADLKSVAGLARGSAAFLTQYLGDLDNRAAREMFEQSVSDLKNLYQAAPESVIADQHPAYISSRWARRQQSAFIGVQHHVAHFFSCLAEHGHRDRALGICWDGTGWSADNTIRGGEFLRWDGDLEVSHIAGLSPFPLPGGEAAIRNPRRQAAGLLYAALGRGAFADEFFRDNFEPAEQQNLAIMLERGIYSPVCTSAGRLFDAVAALLGLVGEVSFEGQAAMAVEFAAQQSDTRRSYPFALKQQGSYRLLDWEPLAAGLLEDGRRGVPAAERARAFHNTLAQMMHAVAVRAGEEHIFLSGGVFQNRLLTESAARLLRQDGFRVHCHSRVPPNDGGIALGQIYFARCGASYRTLSKEGYEQCV